MSKLLLIFIMINWINTESVCIEGCLKCNANKTCEICDTSKSYILQSGKCSKTESENCQKIDLQGVCLVCFDNFYIDKTTKKCLEIQKVKKVENCKSYDTNQNCYLCEEQYFLKNSICTKISSENSISNCKFYSSENNCQKCQDGYILSSNALTCTKPEGSNCMNYSQVKCIQCSNGYISNPSLYLQEYLQVTNSFQKNSLLNFIQKNEKYSDFIEITKHEICQQVIVENCEEISSFNSCQKCISGFYIENNLCVRNPESSIKNCKKYTSSTECQECEQEYYLQSSNQCVAVDKSIDNFCKTFSTTANKTLCNECEENYYLKQENTCQVRNKKIDNCLSYNLNLDECTTCSVQYKNTDDNLLCLPKIENCETYKSSTQETTSHTCQKCKNGFHLKDNICVPGTIDFCEIYKEESTSENQQCKKCFNKYFLSANKCKVAEEIEFCSINHSDEDKACFQCQSEKQNFLVNSHCKFVSPIPSCKTYESLQPEIKCSSCEDGYILNAEKTQCNKIITKKNCLTLAGNGKCNKCIEGYVYAEDDSGCVPIYEQHKYNCKKLQLTPDGDFEDNTNKYIYCQECEENHFPLEYTKVCQKQDEFDGTVIPHCESYEYPNVCERCKSGYVFENNECITDCGTKVVKLNDFKQRTTCATGTGDNTNCKIMNHKSKCIQCKDNYLSYLDNTTNTSTFNYRKPSLDYLDIRDPLERFYIYKCADYSNITKLNNATFANQIDSNCGAYMLDPDNANEYFCVKCKEFYTGKVNIEKGFVYDCKKDESFYEIKKHNLSYNYDKLLSGYKCKDENLRPFMVVRTNETNYLNCTVNFEALSGADQQSKLNSKISEKNIFCYNPFSFPWIDNSFKENCQLFAIKMTYSGGRSSQACEYQSTECIACDFNYKLANKKCITARQNCEGDDWYNACSKCVPGTAYRFDTSLDIQDCYTNTDQNCLIFKKDLGRCILCKKGYSNVGQITCVPIMIPNCANQKMTTGFEETYIGVTRSNWDDNFFAIFFNMNYQLNGCNQCQEGYVGLYFYSRSCFPDSLDQTNLTTDQLTHSQHIKYCKIYGIYSRNKVICIECETGKMLKSTTSDVNRVDSCVEQNLQNNCLRVNQTNQCQKCKDGYTKKTDGTCFLYEIDNCVEFFTESSQTQKNCKTCRQFYRFNTTQLKCLKPSVENCETFDDNDNCSKCYTGYGGIKNPETNFITYCFPIQQSLNCVQANIIENSQYGAEFACTKCSQEFGYITSDGITNKTLCMGIPVIENCIEYHKQQKISESTYVCTKCKEDFYLQNNGKECKARTYLDSENCIQKQLNADECDICKEGYYRHDNGCKINPQGIFACIEYSNQTSCQSCQGGYFSDGINCLAVQTEMLIENCKIYKSGTLCQECKLGFFLEENKCNKIEVSKCLKILSSKECEVCEEGYKVEEVDGIKNCSSKIKPNCIKYDMTKDREPCILCNAPFYASTESGECIEVEKEFQVSLCLYYENSKECKQCQDFSVLSLDKKKCVPYANHPNGINQCQVQKESEYFCSQCQGGFIMTLNGCEKCSQNDQASGCFMCTLDQEKCYVCLPGWYMNEEQKCVKIVDNTEVIDSNKNIMILQTFLLLILTLIQQLF